MKMYKIVRMYQNHPSVVVRKRLTLVEAQRHCRDPETSSKTRTKPDLIAHTERMGPWFDGYDDE